MHARGAISPNQAFAGIRLPKSREAPQIELMLIFYLDSKFDSYKGNNSYYKGVANSLGLAVFSLSNERAGPKDRKYDPSRSHYKKVSLLRDRLIPAVGTILQL